MRLWAISYVFTVWATILQKLMIFLAPKMSFKSTLASASETKKQTMYLAIKIGICYNANKKKCFFTPSWIPIRRGLFYIQYI